MKSKGHGRSKSDPQNGTIRRPAAQSSIPSAAAQENEESLQTFFNALDDLVFVFDPDGRILFANPAAHNLLGYTPAELAGMAAFNLHPPEQRPEAAKLLAGVIAGKIVVCPIPLLAKDGTRILVETKILPGQWRGKDALFGISHDITRRKQAEETMRESEEKYKALIETTGTGYVILDSDGKVLGANQEYVRLTGRSSLMEIIGKSVVEWTAAQDRERNVAEIRKCFQQGFVRNLEIDYVKQEGQVTPVEINATVVKGGQGVHVLALCRDITERKLAEEAMQESEARFHQLFDDAPIGYHEIDREGRITRVNRTELDMLGYTAEEMLRQPVWKFIGEEKLSQQTVLAKLAGTLPPDQGYERTFQRKDQTTLPVLIDDRILHDAEGRIAGMLSVMLDITARKGVEEALANERAVLRTLMDHLPMAIYLKDLAGRKTLVNRVELNYLGATSEAEVLGKTDFDFFPREQAAAYRAIDEGVIRSGQPIINREGSFTKPDGTVLYFLGSIVPLRDVAGRITGLAGINLDITDRKRAEEDLANERAFLRALVDHLPLAVYMGDLDGRRTLANPVELDYIGATSEAEVLGKTAFDLFPPEVAAAYRADDIEVIRSGRPAMNREGSFTKHDGSVIWLLVSKVPIRDSAGRVTGLLGINYDITDRKRANEALANERVLLRTLVDHLPMAVYLKDLAGRKTLVNRVELDYVGATSETEVLGKTDFDLFPPEKAAGFHAIDQEIIRTGQPVINREASFTKPDGSIIWLLRSKVPIHDSAGRLTSLLGINYDITDRKRIEERLLKVVTQTRCILSSGHVTGPEGWRERAMEPVSPFHWDTPVLNEQTAQKIVPLDLAAEEPYFQAFARSLNHEDAARMNWNSGNTFLNDLPFYRNEYRCTDKHGVKHWMQEFVTVQKLAENRWQIFSIAMDISELKRVEVELRESQALYHSLVDQMPAGVFRKDAEGRFTFVNSVFCQLKEMSPERFLGKTVLEVGLPDGELAARGESHHELIMRTGNQIEDDEEHPVADGKTRNYHCVKSPVFDSAGQIVGTQGVLFDITERKNAEKALRQGEMRLEKINRCLLELGPNFDSNINRLTALCGELLGASCALYNRLQGDLLCSIGQWQTPPGFKSEDVSAGHICYDVIRNNREEALVITNLPQTSYAETDPNVRSHGLQTYMGCAVKREGKAVGSLCVAYKTDYRPTDDDRRILGIIASAIGNEDMRRQAEAELNRLMTAIEQTPESVVITDTEGRILYVNPVFERVTGYSRAEAIGQNTRLLKSNRQESAFYRQLWAKISAGEVWRGRFVNKKKDGTHFTEDAVIAPVRNEKGAVTNYIAIKRDVTHELELEVQYRQSQKIDSIGRLAGGVAHDFNNILAVICGHTDLALAQLSPDAPLRSNLECIQESAERAANLTRQLLAFARRQVIEPRRINLNELIVNLNKMLRRLIGEDIKLITQTAPDLGQIKADPGQIEQVLLNLVVNARDAMPDGGILTIRTSNVTLDEQYARRHLVTPGDYVLVSVSDTGVGMTDEVKQHIFEPFFTTKEQGKGTGLGLATCFGIIQQSNGHIHSESQLEKGTQFKIYLPRVSGVEDSVSSREAPVNLPQGTETILLAEDETSLRQLMARVLRSQGYTVLEASDGHQALTLAQANGAKIQLLLTDVIMPGLSGKTLAEWLGQVNPGIRVLFISGYINNNAVRDAMSKPGTFFLQKPFNPLDLTKKVREAIESP